MTITWRQMGAMLFFALLLHVAVAMWLTLPEPPPLVEPAPPVKISLLASVAEVTTTPPPAAEVAPPSQSPSPPTEPRVVPALKPEPRPQLAPKTPPVSSPQAALAEPEPEPVQEPEPEPEPVQEPSPPPEEVVQQTVATPRQSPVQEVAASTKPLSEAAMAEYEQLLVAWLEKHKKYPRRAKRMRIEGEAMVRILIDRDGRVQQVALAQPTGNRLLDRAVIDMAHRASPFPPMPTDDLRPELAFVVPVVFALR